MEIALIAIPTLVLIPYGKEITRTTLDDIIIEEMKSISLEHGFWAQTMSNVVDQHEFDNHTETVLTRMINILLPPPPSYAPTIFHIPQSLPLYPSFLCSHSFVYLIVAF